jgi:hypothetical protein
MATRKQFRLRAAAGLGLSALLSGCVTSDLTLPASIGAIYSRQTRPLMTNFDATPVAIDSGSNDVKTVTVDYFTIAWGRDGIGDIARTKGIAEVYYADLQRTTILGYFRRDQVRIYGRAIDSPAPPGVAAYPVDEDTGQ